MNYKHIPVVTGYFDKCNPRRTSASSA